MRHFCFIIQRKSSGNTASTWWNRLSLRTISNKWAVPWVDLACQSHPNSSVLLSSQVSTTHLNKRLSQFKDSSRIDSTPWKVSILLPACKASPVSALRDSKVKCRCLLWIQSTRLSNSCRCRKNWLPSSIKRSSAIWSNLPKKSGSVRLSKLWDGDLQKPRESNLSNWSSTRINTTICLTVKRLLNSKKRINRRLC